MIAFLGMEEIEYKKLKAHVTGLTSSLCVFVFSIYTQRLISTHVSLNSTRQSLSWSVSVSVSMSWSVEEINIY